MRATKGFQKASKYMTGKTARKAMSESIVRRATGVNGEKSGGSRDAKGYADEADEVEAQEYRRLKIRPKESYGQSK